jgi:hypothetical protein
MGITGIYRNVHEGGLTMAWRQSAIAKASGLGSIVHIFKALFGKAEKGALCPHKLTSVTAPYNYYHAPT